MTTAAKVSNFNILYGFTSKLIRESGYCLLIYSALYLGLSVHQQNELGVGDSAFIRSRWLERRTSALFY